MMSDIQILESRPVLSSLYKLDVEKLELVIIKLKREEKLKKLLR